MKIEIVTLFTSSNVNMGVPSTDVRLTYRLRSMNAIGVPSAKKETKTF